MTAVGPSRDFARAQQFGRFEARANVKWQVGPLRLVALDPVLTLV